MQEQTVQMERMSEKANMQDLLIRHFLRMLPLATTIGNHESKGTDINITINNPNSEDGTWKHKLWF